MARPLNQGPDAVSQDINALTKAMRRIEADESRPKKDRDKAAENLRAVIAYLLNLGAPRGRATKSKRAA